MVSDIVLLKELPAALRDSVAAYTGCVAGALMKDDYLRKIGAAGFQNVEIIAETLFPMQELVSHPAAKELSIPSDTVLDMAEQLTESIASIEVYAVKRKE